MTLWAVALSLLAAAGVGGYALGRGGRGRVALASALTLAVVLAGLLILADQVGGWDGLGLAAVAAIGLGPVVLGLAAGALAGWLAQRLNRSG